MSSQSSTLVLYVSARHNKPHARHTTIYNILLLDIVGLIPARSESVKFMEVLRAGSRRSPIVLLTEIKAETRSSLYL
jgi:hypothetical protein